MTQLRQYQQDAVDAILRELQLHRSTMAELATGTGKSLIAAEVVRRHLDQGGQRALVVAHRRELLTQLAGKIRDAGVTHGVHVDSIQAIALHLASYPRGYFDLIVIDECFPAGTLVGTIPIERLRVGDLVPSFDEQTGKFTHKRVVRCFTSKPRTMVRVSVAGKLVTCTAGHPFWTLRGWVPAALLTGSDMVLYTTHGQKVLGVPVPDLQRGCNSDRKEAAGLPSVWPGLLLGEAQAAVQERGFIAHDGGNQSQVRLEAYDGAQSHAQPEVQRAYAYDAARDGMEAQDTRWQRYWSYHAGTVTSMLPRLGNGCGRNGGKGTRQGVADQLQARCGQRATEDRDRGGWRQSLLAGASGARSQERGVLAWSRVDCVEVLEPTSDGTFGGVCPDGLVYNIEVEDTHTYVADGFVVHNCHHAATKSYRRVVEHFVAAEVVGFTATPERSDGAMLGSVFGSVAFRYGTHEAIRDGWLVPPHPIPVGEFSARDLMMRVGARPTIAFTESVQAAIWMADELNALRHGCAAVVHGEMPARERDAALDAYRQGSVQFLCNCAILTEGTDLPITACVALVRSVNSRGLRKQIVGRAMRLSQGKQQALVLDYHGYAPLDLGSPANPLEGKKALPRGEKMRVKRSILERVWRFLNLRIF